jgi:predicted nucleotidyltransferase
MTRRLSETMDDRIVAEIDARLDALSKNERVALPLAVESGSRAWGFPSPDSDYDCRFLFIRATEEYLSPWPRRDVIETPLDETFDVNGWDLAKALQLLLRGNAVVIEWLTSPLWYRRDEAFVEAFLELARAVADRRRVMRHYLHLGENQRRRNFADANVVPRKKLFYALRPAAALRWLRLHPDDAVAPMNFSELMRGCTPPPEVLDIAQTLVAEKARSSEMGAGPLDPVLARFIDEEFARLRDADDVDEEPPPAPDAQARAEAFFLEQLRRAEAGAFR